MASAAFLRSLKKGQILNARVEDITPAEGLLCNFEGQLLRISNHSGLGIVKGQAIKLQVTQTDPLSFQIFDPNSVRFSRTV